MVNKYKSKLQSLRTITMQITKKKKTEKNALLTLGCTFFFARAKLVSVTDWGVPVLAIPNPPPQASSDLSALVGVWYVATDSSSDASAWFSPGSSPFQQPMAFLRKNQPPWKGLETARHAAAASIQDREKTY